MRKASYISLLSACLVGAGLALLLSYGDKTDMSGPVEAMSTSSTATPTTQGPTFGEGRPLTRVEPAPLDNAGQVTRLIGEYRASRNYRALIHRATVSNSLLEADLARAYFLSCLGLPDSWKQIVDGSSSMSPAEKTAHNDLIAACASVGGDLQLLESVNAKRRALMQAKGNIAGPNGDREKLHRMAADGNSASLINEVFALSPQKLLSLVGESKLHDEGIQVGKDTDMMLRMALENSICASLGCDERFYFAIHCSSNPDLCGVKDITERFSLIATKYSGVSHADWKKYREISDAAVRRIISSGGYTLQ